MCVLVYSHFIFVFPGKAWCVHWPQQVEGRANPSVRDLSFWEVSCCVEFTWLHWYRCHWCGVLAGCTDIDVTGVVAALISMSLVWWLALISMSLVWCPCWLHWYRCHWRGVLAEFTWLHWYRCHWCGVLAWLHWYRCHWCGVLAWLHWYRCHWCGGCTDIDVTGVVAALISMSLVWCPCMAALISMSLVWWLNRYQCHWCGCQVHMAALISMSLVWCPCCSAKLYRWRRMFPRWRRCWLQQTINNSKHHQR